KDEEGGGRRPAAEVPVDPSLARGSPRGPAEVRCAGAAALPGVEIGCKRHCRQVKRRPSCAIISHFPRCGKMGQTLYDKLWDSHLVHSEPDGTSLLYIDRHLIHEVTSPQAYEGLK